MKRLLSLLVLGFLIPSLASAQQFIPNLKTTNSTSTNATTTNLAVSSLTSGNCVQASNGGVIITTGSACGAGGGLPYPFPLNVNATSSVVGFFLGWLSSASSTNTGSTTLATTLLTNGTSTNFSITNLANDSIVTTNKLGVLTASSTIGNNQLQNNSIIVTTASPLGGAGTISLGGTLALTCTTCSSGSFAFPFTKQADGFQATSTGILLTGGLVVSGTASSTFQQPIVAPNVATTTTVFADHCDIQANSVDSTLGGGSFFQAENMTNNVAALLGLHLSNATTSEMTCWFVIPHTTSSSTLYTMTTATSTSAGFVNLDIYYKDINPIGGNYDPSNTSVQLLLNASSTPANRLAIGGTAWQGYGTTTSFTTLLNQGDIVPFTFKRWSRASGDTYNGDVIFGINPYLVTQN